MIEPTDGTSTLCNPGKEPIRQFVIYAEHKVGWLNDFVSMLNGENIDILAISVLDTTDSAVIRLIPNYPKDLARLLKSLSISFTERTVLAVELVKGRFYAKPNQSTSSGRNQYSLCVLFYASTQWQNQSSPLLWKTKIQLRMRYTLTS